MPITPNTADFYVVNRVDFVADTHAEVITNAATMLDSYVYVREDDAIVRINVSGKIGETRHIGREAPPDPEFLGALFITRADAPQPPDVKGLWLTYDDNGWADLKGNPGSGGFGV